MANENNQSVGTANTQNNDGDYNVEAGNAQVCYVIDAETGDIVISQPEAGMSDIIDLELGGNYVFDFPPANVASLIEQDGNLAIEFTDGSSLILNNFGSATSGAGAATLVTDAGAVVNTTEFIETMAQIGNQDVAEFLNDPRCEIRKVFAENDAGDIEVQEVAVVQSPRVLQSAAQDLADIAPAAGEETADPSAVDLANIEPEAGQGALGATGRGFGFQSSFAPTGVNGLDDTGPLGATELNYDLPEFGRIEEVSLAPPLDPIPTAVSLNPLLVDETDLDDNGIENHAGQFNVDFGSDGPGTFYATNTFSFSGSAAGGQLTSDGNPIAVNLVGNQYVGTANGQTIFTMDINPDGTYQFNLLGRVDHADTSDPNDVINLVFGITAEDNDGDSLNGNIPVQLFDDGPEIISRDVLTTDETVVDANGSDDDSGQITVDFGLDGAGTIVATGANTFTATGSVAGGTLTSGGHPVTVTVDANGNYVGTANGQTVFTMEINNNGSYIFDLVGTLDHADTSNPDDFITLGFNVTITDNDGDSVQTTLNVNVNDDGPVAADDAVSVTAGTGDATGNVLGNDDAGADDSDVAVLDVSFGGNTVTAGNSIAGQYGTLTVNADGSYTYTPNGTNTTDVTDVFTYTMRDADGDTAQAQLTINVAPVDDTPQNIVTQNLVTDETDLDDNGTESDSGLVTADFGNDGPGTFSATGVNTFDASGELAGGALTSCGNPVTVTLVGNQYIGTANGQTIFTLDLQSDGNYTFNLLGQLDHADTTNPNEPIYLRFGVTATDADGDSANGAIRVTVLDDGPHVGNVTLRVNETDLDNNGTESASGTLTFDYGLDGGGTLGASDVNTFTAGGSLAGGALTSEGNPVTVTLVGNQYIGTANGQTVFTLDVNPNGSTVFNLLGTLDHADGSNPNDVINLGFGVTITDKDGDTDTAVITVYVNDDGPVAVNDTLTTANDTGPATGNVLGNDDAGADDSDVAVLDVSFGGNTVTAGNSIAGQYGTLTVNADGSYTYTPNGTNTSTVTDVFTYTMRDADGDTSQAQLTVTVSNDDTPVITSVDPLITDETDLDNNGTESDSGTVTADFGSDGPGTFSATGANTFSVDGGGALTSCGNPVTVTLVGDQYVGTANGVTVFTLDIQPNGDYTFNLLGQLDHPNPNTPNEPIDLNFGVTATDADGDSVTGNIDVRVQDDAPSVSDITLNVDETDLDDNGTESDSGTLVFDYGLDAGGTIDATGANTFTASGSLAGGALTSDGNPVTVTLVGDQYVGTANGQTVFTLDVNANGTTVFNLLGQLDHADGTNPDDVITLGFGVTITDKDGDTDTAVITVNVNDDGPAVNNAITLCVDETVLDNTGSANDTQTISGDFGLDGAGTIAATGANTFTAGGSLAGGALTSEGNPVTVTLVGGQYVGTANGQTIFTLDVNSNGTYSFDLLGTLDHADGTNPDDIIDLTFGVTVTDADGDSVTQDITVQVHDDGPVAASDTLNVAAGQPSGTGNVLTNDDAGADDSDVAVLDVSFGGNTVTAGNSIAGQYGTLTVNADGSYTYLANGNNNGNVTDVFTYTMRDADGDTATSTLYVNIGDNNDTPQNLVTENLVTDETDLDNNGTESDSGVVTADFGNDGPGTFSATGANTFSVDGGGALTSCGNPVTVTLVGNQYIGTSGGDTIFTLTIQPNGNYTFDLLGQLDHPNPNTPNEPIDLNFGVTATDADGDAATGNINVRVRDDGPSVGNVTLRVDETIVDGTGSDTESGTMVFDFGLDAGGTIEASGANTFTAGGSLAGGALTSDGNPVTVTLVGDQYVGTANGATVFTLDINNNGTYTFTLVGTLDHADGTNPDDVINLQFGVTVTDKDGDTDTAVVTVYVNDDGPVAVNDTLSTANDTNATGNVLSNDDAGADDSDVAVLDVSFGGNTVTAGNSIAGQYGTLTVNADGSYTYTPNGTNTSTVTDVFTYTMRDADGDTSQAQLTVTVSNDDTPVITSVDPLITDETDLDNNGTESDSGTVTADFGSDGPGEFCATDASSFSFSGATGGQLTSCGNPVVVTLVGDQYIGTANGQTVFTLDIQSNGNYTFNLLGQLDHSNTGSNNESLFLNFGVTAKDADGDTATGSIRVTVQDDGPSVGNVTLRVDETDLDDNGTEGDSGTLVFDYGLDAGGTIDASGANTFTAGGSLAGGALTSNGVAVVVALVGSQYVGTANGATVFTLDINPDGSTVFNLLGTLDHADGSNPNDVINLGFGVTITDKDGDTDTGVITVQVNDDGPVAVNDTLSTANDTNATGNVLSNDDAGADDGDVAVLDVSFGGNTVTAGNSIAGQYGTLTVNADGTFTYTPNGTNTATVTDVFTYTMRDADGDTSQAQLTVTVSNDDTPIIISTDPLTTDETDLHDDGTESDSGTVTADFGSDGPGEFCAADASTFSVDGGLALTSCGNPVVVTVDANGNYVGTAGGDTIFTLTIQPNGNYTFNLLGQLDHPDSTNPNDAINLNFGVIAKDADGDIATGNINVQVLDDGPVAIDTFCAVDETSFGTAISVTGQLMQAVGVPFDYGQDGAGSIEGNNNFTTTDAPYGNVIGLTSDGNAVSVVWNAATSQYVGTANGATVFTLSVDDTGAYTYTQFAPIDHPNTNNHNERVVLNFGIDVTDKDGDSVSATIQVDVYDDGPQLISTETLCVDETDLPVENDTGSLNVDFGADGVGNIYGTGVGTFGFSGSALNNQLTSDGDPVSVTVNANGDYVGTAGGDTIFTLTFNNNGTYTFNLIGELDHADPTDPNDIIDLTFGVTVEDGDGDTDTGSITVQVKDDGPTIVNGTPTVGNAFANVDETSFGSTLAANGSVNYNFGTDGAGDLCLDGTFTALDAPGGNAINLTSNGSAVNVALNGAGDYVGTAGGRTVFTLSLNESNGTYQFRQFETLDHLDPNNPNDSLVLSFGTKITDSDGDRDTGAIFITVNDDGPVALDTFCVQSENNLGTNINGQLKSALNVDVDFGADGGAVVANNSFHATHDLYGSHETITSGGNPVSVSYNGSQYVGTAGGQTVFTLTVRGDGSYTYNQVRELDHDASTGNVLYLNFGVDVVDGDGDTVSVSVQVDVYDATHHSPITSGGGGVTGGGFPAGDIDAGDDFTGIEDPIFDDGVDLNTLPVFNDEYGPLTQPGSPYDVAKSSDALSSLDGVTASDDVLPASASLGIENVIDMASTTSLQQSIDGFVAETGPAEAGSLVVDQADTTAPSAGGLSLSDSGLSNSIGQVDVDSVTGQI